MTIVNRLIKEAKAVPPPKELVIPANHIRQVADHMARTLYHGAMERRMSTDEAVDKLVDGGVTLLGVPLRVLT